MEITQTENIALVTKSYLDERLDLFEKKMAVMMGKMLIVSHAFTIVVVGLMIKLL